MGSQEDHPKGELGEKERLKMQVKNMNHGQVGVKKAKCI